MKISFVIPTKDRLDTLRHCVDAALSTRSEQLEIIVSNNHSSDGTAEFLASKSDPRLRVVSPPVPMSMRGHYDFALTQTTGDYIVFIGDDDAITPFGPDALVHLIETTGADAIAWKPIGYLWPGMEGEDGLSRTFLKPKHFSYAHEVVDHNAMFERFVNATHSSYLEGAKIYHGAVSRGLVQRLTAQSGGSYFGAMSPDVYASIFGLKFATRFVRTSCSITISGKSKKSSGWALLKAKGDTDVAERFFEDEFNAAQRDPKNYVDLSIRSTASHELNALMIGNQALCDGALAINYSAWLEKIASSYAYANREEYSKSATAIRALATELGVATPDITPFKIDNEPAPVLSDRVKFYSSAHVEIHSTALPTVTEVCACLDMPASSLSRGTFSARFAWRRRRSAILERIALRQQTEVPLDL